MFALNPICNQSPEKFSQVPLQMLRMGHVLTLLPMASGEVGSRELSLMSEFSILMLPPTDNPACLLVYRKHESLKKRAYEQRVREVEHSSFTSLVLSATGGLANEATTFYKRLASCLVTKWDYSYSSTMSWLRCRLMFSLLRSAIQCIKGARSSSGHATK